MAELNISLNTTSKDEHVRDIEWYIQTVKERMRAVYNTLPFLKIPSHTVFEMAKYAIFWLNTSHQSIAYQTEAPKQSSWDNRLTTIDLVTSSLGNMPKHTRNMTTQCSLE